MGQNSDDNYIKAILDAKVALEKPIQERDGRDIMRIDELCSLLHGFDGFTERVRRALAANAVLVVIEEKDKELIVDGEPLDSFCVVMHGGCIHYHEDKLIEYKVGDSFGICESTVGTITFSGYMKTICESCAFLCVLSDDYITIVDDPANFNKGPIQYKFKGVIECVTQFNIDKKSIGPICLQKQSTDPYKIHLLRGHNIIKSTEEWLLSALVGGYDRIDSNFIEDFLLLFRVFMTPDQRDRERKLPPGMSRLCSDLVKWLGNNEYGYKVVKIIVIWLSLYYHDFELNSNFSHRFFEDVESRLITLQMTDQLLLLRETLSAKSKIRHVTISRSSREQPLTFSIGGGYEKNCGIFVTKVPCNSSMNYSQRAKFNPQTFYTDASTGAPPIPPRSRTTQVFSYSNNHDIQTPPPLKPGDQILEVNGTNFAAISLAEAQKKLDISTHLSLTVKYNPCAFHEMRAVPEGRRKSSQSSMSSISPYQPPINQSRFKFNTDQQNSNKLLQNHKEARPPHTQGVVKYLIKNSKQLVKNVRDSTVYTQSTSNNIETMSKTSADNTSDDVSCEGDSGNLRIKSNPDLLTLRSNKLQPFGCSLSNIVRLDDQNPASIADHSSANGSNNQALVNVLRVFNAANNDFRYLVVHEETTAREVVMVAVKEFNLTGSSGPQTSPGDKAISSLNWHLYEVSVVHQSQTIKQKCLSDQTSRLAERASLCSRFYIKNNTQSSFGPTRLDMGDSALVEEILKESPKDVSLTLLDPKLLAKELTLADFDKFRSIEPQQFVYDTFFDYSEKNNQNPTNGWASSIDSASLKSSSSDGQEPDLLHTINKARSIPKSWMKEYQEFANVSNKEMFWVVCEILNEPDTGRRVKIVKKFVKVAEECEVLGNYNSMFAIISGLDHSCVKRLRRTFEKLNSKYKNQLERMSSLFNPSKNMLNYRDCLQKREPPAIPLFPQIKKDLTFTKEGRSIFVRETNNRSYDGISPQGTIRKKNVTDLSTLRSSSTYQTANLQHTPYRPISYTSFNNRETDGESILINFAEIRQFTERVSKVIHFSSVPYAKDLNAYIRDKDNQGNQAQIKKKMHEEWQMRKRIRHYINQTLNSAINDPFANNEKYDQTDSNCIREANGKLTIIYDEKTLHQKSLEVEPELNTRPAPVANPRTEHPTMAPSVSAHPPIQPQVLPIALNIYPPPMCNHSPTLSKSSSLSSCSSSNHHHFSYALPSNNLTSSVGKFGGVSTESLRKLEALSEKNWSQYNNGSNNGANGRSNNLANSRMIPPRPR